MALGYVPDVQDIFLVASLLLWSEVRGYLNMTGQQVFPDKTITL